MTKRLIDTLKPINYNVHFILDEDLKSFESISKITATTQRDTDKIQLNAKDFTIKEITILSGEKKLETESYKLIEDEDILEISLQKSVTKNQELHITISAFAPITTTMHGVYPATYTEAGVEKTIISTQFESHHAREAFVCIDEPAAKATFDVSITGPEELTYLSNMPATATKGRTTIFEQTPVMSTYLLAFAVGDYKSLIATSKRGVEVRTFARPSQVNDLNFALDVAKNCLDFFEDYFEIDYPLPKADFVVIPEFAAAAMENWGLITFRETALLHNSKETSLVNKQRIAEVICHELAHQWFGNLVTMKWWDDLWLNEGFASWAAALAVDSLFPSWKTWATFVAEDYSHALSQDALENSHPIRVPVESPKDISEIFDDISYRKGASVIRMLHDYLGSDVFKKGIKSYLQKHAYGNATTDDLWQSLSSASGVDVSAFMKPWTESMGYPYVLAEKQDDMVVLTQEHFLINPKAQPRELQWPVPLIPSSPLKHSVLTDKSLSFKAPSTVLKLNSNQSGFYRVGYDKQWQNTLAANVDNLNLIDRLSLLDDAAELAIAGKKETTEVLELLKSYTKENTSQVWSVIGATIHSIRSTLLNEDNEMLLAPFVSDLISQQYKALGWEEKPDETENDQLIRPIVLALASRFELFDSEEQITKLYASGNITPNLRSIIYTFIARTGDARDYDHMWNSYLTEELQEQKNRWAGALTQFKNEDLISKSIAAIRSDHVRMQDSISWAAGLMRNRKSHAQMWQWYENNWDWVEEKFAHGHLYSYFVLILANFNEQEKIQEVRNFFKNKNTDGINRSIEQVIEKIEYKSSWKQRDAQKVQQWLSGYASTVSQ